MNCASPRTTPWAPHVRWAEELGTVFILDLKADAYLALPLDGWAHRRDALASRRLLECGDLAIAAPRIRSRRNVGALTAFASLLWAREVLRRGRLEAAAALLREAPGALDAETDVLIQRFQNLRPLYPREASCLFDSLALGRFLADGGIRAELVFAVRGAPFAAHAWLEKEGRILNDDAEYCAGFVRMSGP
jgi:hypothetical protein